MSLTMFLAFCILDVTSCSMSCSSGYYGEKHRKHARRVAPAARNALPSPPKKSASLAYSVSSHSMQHRSGYF